MTTLLDTERINSLRLLSRCAPKTGSGAEVGVYKGGSLRVIAEELAPRGVLGFDTFSGLPAEDWASSEHHKAGEFGDTSIEVVEKSVADLPNITLIKGHFPQCAEMLTFFHGFAFVHLDMDFYAGTKAAVEWFWPRMVSGGIIVLDDYQWPHCPGIERALIEFGQPIHSAAQYQAHIIKP